MNGVLLVGAGEVGVKHLAALAGMPGVKVVGIADPHPLGPVPSGPPVFLCWREALEATTPDLVVVAIPPGTALVAAREAASTGAAVLVEKPATVDPQDVAQSRPEDRRIHVAFQSHFAPGLDRLSAYSADAVRAEVSLAVRRDAAYFRGWRRTRSTAGGVLHQQAIHGLALALRMFPGDVGEVDASVVHRRNLAEIEDQVTATVGFAGGGSVLVDARVDHDGPPRHEVVVLRAGGRRLHVRGRNLEAGLGDLAAAPSHCELRRRMYAAALRAHAGGPVHPALFPMSELSHLLEVIDRVYRAAGIRRVADTAAA